MEAVASLGYLAAVTENISIGTGIMQISRSDTRDRPR